MWTSEKQNILRFGRYRCGYDQDVHGGGEGVFKLDEVGQGEVRKKCFWSDVFDG